jgi:predicted lysophospholipase L1 biosynthesis ABC-type transport system permease subunit
MLKLVKACAPWLTWKVGLVAVLGLVVLVSFDKLLGAVLVGATPVVLALACLIPCLIPLVFLRKKKTASPITPTPADTKSESCNCGGDNCQIGEHSSSS